MADATPQNKIRRPRFTQIDQRSLVDRLEPTRYEPRVEYILGNGRQFKRDQGE